MKFYLIGASGSGKTVVGIEVARQLSVPHTDTDTEIALRMKATSVGEIFETRGEAFFRARERELLHEIANSNAPAVISTGGGMPAISGAMDCMLSTGAVVYLRARPTTLWRRLDVADEIKLRPLLYNRGIQALRHLCNLRRHHYIRAHIVIETDHLEVKECVELALCKLRSGGFVVGHLK